jgi:hypothetical protein
MTAPARPLDLLGNLSSHLFGNKLATLAAQVAGGVARPGDTEYGDAAPWARSVESRPAAVVFAESAQDVLATVRYARANRLRVAVRSTGHGATPIDDDVLLLHTGRMTECIIDEAGRWARVAAGVRWQQVLDAACPLGLAPLCGSAPAVGVVGYLTGGGLGPVARTYGMSSDHVRAFEVVTGDGALRRVTPTEHPDLFWGLRGGKATLGIVTAIEFDLPLLADLYGGSMWFAESDRAVVLTAWRRMATSLPEAGTTSAAVMNLPPLPQLPPAIAGRSTVAIRFAWTGDPETGAACLAELRRAATPLLDSIGVMPYSELGRIHADPVDPMPVTTHSALLGDLPENGLEAFLAAIDGANPHTIVELRALGGALARGPRHPSAVCHREAAYSLFLSAVARPETASAVTEHAEGVLSALAPWTMPGLLSNFEASDDPAVIARYYDVDTAQRLATLADHYDPYQVLDTGQVARVARRTPLT